MIPLVRELGTRPYRSVSASRSLNYLACRLPPPRFPDIRAELTGPWKLIGKLLSLFACTAFSNCWKFNGLMPGGSLFFAVAFFNVISVHGVGTFPVFIATGVSCACSEP